jgi:hypothetical protein
VAGLTVDAVTAIWQFDAWLARLRRFWSANVDALERYLDRMDLSTRTNGKAEKSK